ncbi:unnamed protein product, partial [Gordionus sp. m RMFG-2023]
FQQMRMWTSEEINEVKKHIENMLDLICIEEYNIDVDENMILPLSPNAKRIKLKASASKLNPNIWEDEVVTEESILPNDITKYLNLKISIEEEDILKTDILLWWKRQERDLPKLSRLARKILAIPATRTSDERGFSTAGRFLEQRRRCLNPENVESLLFLHYKYI